MIIELGLDITRNFQVRFEYYPNLTHNFFLIYLKKKKKRFTFWLSAPFSDFMASESVSPWLWLFLLGGFNCHFMHNYIPFWNLGHLVQEFKYMFSVFKQHYTYFHTFFHPHVFPKNTNNVTKQPLVWNNWLVSWFLQGLDFAYPLVYLIVVGLLLSFCFFYAYLLELIVWKNCLVL